MGENVGIKQRKQRNKHTDEQAVINTPIPYSALNTSCICDYVSVLRMCDILNHFIKSRTRSLSMIYSSKDIKIALYRLNVKYVFIK